MHIVWNVKKFWGKDLRTKNSEMVNHKVIIEIVVQYT